MRHLLGLIGFVILVAAGGADWPQFRGPDGTGVTTGAAPIKWTEKDGVKWKTALPGPGASSPIVSGGRVYVTCFSGADAAAGSADKLKRHLVCIDQATGAVQWSVDVPGSNAEDAYRGFLQTEHGYASNTPVTDGEAIYAFFSKSGVVAFDLNGKMLWQTSVGTESDERRWGSAASPILYKNLVIVNAASEGRAVFALDKKTGKQVWKAEGKRLSLSFSTPALIKSGDRTELVVAMPGEVWGMNPETGKLHWFATIKPGGNICPTVVAGDGVVYVTGGFPAKGMAAIKVGGSGDLAEKNTLWSSSKGSYIPTPVLHDGHLMYVNEKGSAVCLKAGSGEVLYEEQLALKGGGGRGGQSFYASPVLADGRLYAVSRRSGVFVLKAGDKFEQLQLNPPLDESDFNATPAVADKQLFLRSNKFIYCIEGP